MNAIGLSHDGHNSPVDVSVVGASSVCCIVACSRKFIFLSPLFNTASDVPALGTYHVNFFNALLLS